MWKSYQNSQKKYTKYNKTLHKLHVSNEELICPFRGRAGRFTTIANSYRFLILSGISLYKVICFDIQSWFAHPFICIFVHFLYESIWLLSFLRFSIHFAYEIIWFWQIQAILFIQTFIPDMKTYHFDRNSFRNVKKPKENSILGVGKSILYMITYDFVQREPGNYQKHIGNYTCGGTAGGNSKRADQPLA